MAGEKFTFTLLDSPDLNAFATRDNYVYVNRGLLNYVSNEAQLVSVLAHEVGHITKNMSPVRRARQPAHRISRPLPPCSPAAVKSMKPAWPTPTQLSAVTAAATNSRPMKPVPNIWPSWVTRPAEMISMLSIMKDYEMLQKDRAKAKGASKQTYHGIFSSHPRNDSRLRTVVSKAQTSSGREPRDNGAASYRQLTDGLIWGENFLAKEKKPQRYSDMTMRVRFDYPDGWTQTNDSTTRSSVGSPERQAAPDLSLTPIARTARRRKSISTTTLRSPSWITAKRFLRPG